MAHIPQLTTVIAVVIALSSSSIVKSPSSNDGTFELLILHNNDMHARFEQTSQLSGTCSIADRDAGKCYGGFPRVAHVVKEARNAAASGEGPPVLYLNAGDTYTGTAWFTIYKWKIAAEFLNALQPDAVSLGNHEFDEDIAGVVPFIKNLTSPVLAANLLLDDVPELKEESNLYKSIIIYKRGIKIGIVGYLTPETKFLAPKNKVGYEDEVPSVRREVIKLKQSGVNIIIALGHSGFIKDLEIAAEVEDIDLVIGGHSNTFLANVNTTEIPEFVQGPYPTIVMQKSGRKVLVVQAYAYTKYMGSLYLKFNEQGDIMEFDGKPVLLNGDIPQDPVVLQIVNKYHSDIDRINNIIVGTSLTFLDGDSCRLYECNIGNFISDVMLNYTKRYYEEFSQVNIALIQGGRIRTSIDQPQKPYNLTRGDWITVIPFSDTLCIVQMNGSVLMQALEHSADSWRKIDTPGQFLQMSGIEVTYDLEKIPGSRVIRAKAMCIGCNKLVDIRNSLQYKIIMSAFLADGGDGYVMFEKLEKEFVSYNEVTCVLDYLGKYGPIDPQISGRIRLLNEDKILGLGNNNVAITNNFLPSSVNKIYSDLILIITAVKVLYYMGNYIETPL